MISCIYITIIFFAVALIAYNAISLLAIDLFLMPFFRIGKKKLIMSYTAGMDYEEKIYEIIKEKNFVCSNKYKQKGLLLLREKNITLYESSLKYRLIFKINRSHSQCDINVFLKYDTTYKHAVYFAFLAIVSTVAFGFSYQINLSDPKFFVLLLFTVVYYIYQIISEKKEVSGYINKIKKSFNALEN